MDMNLSKLRKTVEDRETWCAAVHGVTKIRSWLHDWTTPSLAAGVPNPPGHRLAFVSGLLGIRPDSRRWAVVSHKTDPWCLKGWGPLSYRIASKSLARHSRSHMIWSLRISSTLALPPHISCCPARLRFLPLHVLFLLPINWKKEYIT